MSTMLISIVVDNQVTRVPPTGQTGGEGMFYVYFTAEEGAGDHPLKEVPKDYPIDPGHLNIVPIADLQVCTQ